MGESLREFTDNHLNFVMFFVAGILHPIDPCTQSIKVKQLYIGPIPAQCGFVSCAQEALSRRKENTPLHINPAYGTSEFAYACHHFYLALAASFDLQQDSSVGTKRDYIDAADMGASQMGDGIFA